MRNSNGVVNAETVSHGEDPGHRVRGSTPPWLFDVQTALVLDPEIDAQTERFPIVAESFLYERPDE
jgi:hypothetical protein